MHDQYSTPWPARLVPLPARLFTYALPHLTGDEFKICAYILFRAHTDPTWPPQPLHINDILAGTAVGEEQAREALLELVRCIGSLISLPGDRYLLAVEDEVWDELEAVWLHNLNAHAKDSVDRKPRQLLSPDERQVKAQNTRARKMGCEGALAADDWLAIKERQAGRCACCQELPRGKQRLQIDHIRPLARQGSNWPDNIQGLCGPCNNLKGDREIDWRPFLEKTEVR